MSIRYQTNCNNIDWDVVPKLLEEVGMSFVSPEIHRSTFEASYAVVFALDSDKLIGFGRVLSDGFRQAAIYDIAVDPEYQGQKIGKEIVSQLIAVAPTCNFILYASPGKEVFYETLGFKRMKTGMALFADTERMNDGIFVES